MNQSLQVFKSPQFGSIRVLEIDNEPWFVGKEICEYFGDTNYRRSLSRLDPDEKGVSPIDTPGGKQNMVIVNESGLYSLLFMMQPQQANLPKPQYDDRIENIKMFRRWVTSEVLPCIRKHGAYMTPDKLKEVIANPDVLISLANQLRDFQQQIDMQKQVIGTLQPKADYADLILRSTDLVAISQIAKDYGMSANKINKTLRDMRIQYKGAGGQWLLYSKYHDKGYARSETINITHSNGRPGVMMHTKWTQKGRLFLYNKLKEAGILPIIEQEDC